MDFSLLKKICLAGALACGVALPAWSEDLNVVPRPLKMQQTEGAFRLTADAVIGYDAGVREQAEYLQQLLQGSTGWTLELKEGARKADIRLTLAPDEVKAAEGYRLVLKTNTPDAITAAQASPQAGIYAEAGRVCVSAEAGTPIRIYSADGRLLREAVAHSGLNAFGGLEGMVIVSAGATTKKITVKQ